MTSRATNGHLGDLLRGRLGGSPGRTVLLVTSQKGANRPSNAWIRQTLRSMKHRVYDVAPLSAVGGEPSTASAQEAVRMAQRVKCDVVIGSGGSNIMNLSKHIAHTLASDPDDVASTAKTLQYLAVPTVACRGADASDRVELIDWTKEETVHERMSESMRDRFHAILDANLTKMDRVPDAAHAVAALATCADALEDPDALEAGAEVLARLASASAPWSSYKSTWTPQEVQQVLDLSQKVGAASALPQRSWKRTLTEVVSSSLAFPKSVVRAATLWLPDEDVPDVALELHRTACRAANVGSLSRMLGTLLKPQDVETFVETCVRETVFLHEEATGEKLEESRVKSALTEER